MARNSWLILVTVIAIGSSGCGSGQQTEAIGGNAEQKHDGRSAQGNAAEIKKVRGPAVAGMFYPRHKDDLAKRVDRLLADAPSVPIEKLRGLVCPHAGYEFSGPTAAVAYKQLMKRDFQTAIVMASSHYADFAGASIPKVDAYETPLGMIRLSTRVAKIAKNEPFCRAPLCQFKRPPWWRRAPKKLPPFGEDTPHTWEHSLEVQLPFLQQTLPDCTIVPIVFGRADAETVARRLLEHVDDKTLLVASSDLSHYYPYDVARRLDVSCIRAICDLDIDWLKYEEACGKIPILTLMHIAKKKGWKAKLLDYRNSGDTAGKKKHVVGYAAIAFYEPDGKEPREETPATRFTPKEREFMLDLARRALVDAVNGREGPEVDEVEVPAKLTELGGCFVTLTKEGKLRGCIGHILPVEALYQSVLHNARAAAIEDSRFSPVTEDELDEIHIEISVLTMPKRLEFDSPADLVKKLRPGVDGVVLRVGPRLATYLPQVWEQMPDKEMFLGQLSRKAGSGLYGWKSSDAMVLTYQVEAFEQSER